MSERRNTSSFLSAVVAVAVLLGLYVAAYYSMVRPTPKKFQNWAGQSLIFTDPRYFESDHDGGGVAAKVFAPVHWLDRRIRQKTWGGPRPTREEWNAFHKVHLRPPLILP